MKRKSTKKIIMILSAVIVLSIIIVAVLYFTGYPNPEGSIRVSRNDPFGVALNEYDAVVKLIFEPIYPSIGLVEPVSAAIVRYFLDNDITDELNSLNKIYQKALQGDKNSKDQRQKAKDFRAVDIRRMRESLETIHAAMETIRKYADKDEWNFTPEEEQRLIELMWPWKHTMMSKNKW